MVYSVELAKSVHIHFGFLDLYGMSVVSGMPNEIRFESNCSFLKIFIDDRYNEINCKIGLLGHREFSDEEGFSIYEITRLVNADYKYNSVFVTSVDSLDRGVAYLSTLTKKYAHRALICDREFYTELRDMQTIDSDAFVLEGKLSWARHMAKKAWDERDYIKFIEILSPYFDHLSRSEILKLKYASKNVR